MIQIESNVPMPSKYRSKFPFEEMKVGDSFLVESERQRVSAKNAAGFYAAKHGGKFVSRKVEGGYRIWRTE